jgi:uncharacterized membrane protein YebE (DUF533 family)
VQGGLSGASHKPAAAGGIGAVLGSLFGGGGDSMKGALGGGALAMLASVAMKAITNSGGRAQQDATSGWSGGSLPLGLKAPETQDEERALQKTAELVIRGMINAAKSDGQISHGEAQRIVGKLRESGLDEEAQQWVDAELQKPLDVAGFAAEIPNPEVAAQVYAASLLAIEVDTAAEAEYLRQLAHQTNLEQGVVQHIHQTLGVSS